MLEDRGDAAVARMVLLRQRGFDDAAEVHADDSGDAAEEGEADEEVEREGKLGLRDVVTVAEQAPIVEAEPAQVVE